MTWRRWCALCALAGVVVVPLFLEVFATHTPLRFLALPLRWGWAGLVVVPLVHAGWMGPRAAAAVFAALGGLISAVTLVDLAGFTSLHLGWFLALEWWQRPLYPWLDLLPRWEAAGRPGYLWAAAGWTLTEAAVASAWGWTAARASLVTGSRRA